MRRRGIEPRPHPWKGRILTIRPTALVMKIMLRDFIKQFAVPFEVYFDSNFVILISMRRCTVNFSFQYC
uniref:AlNc14C3G427 protein n=1 Tax=Albugo laibachii Nc14 TaxID=890382 RepID=F0VZU9_9STRA|nr:AlNc14C3G427 [Albugo laibachii Nc14]|eukprot:CCA14320.1 AlNc14C3G427 [Albugo laibachii Nc14]